MQLRENLTKSTLLLLPLVVENLTSADIFDKKDLQVCRNNLSFINAYNDDINRPFLTDDVFVAFDFKLDTNYARRSTKLRKLSGFKEDSYYVINKKSYLIYRFEVPQDLVDDYENIVAGHYSLVSFKAKAKILSFWGGYENIIREILGLFTKEAGVKIEDQVAENTYIPQKKMFEEAFANLDIVA